MEMQKKLLDFLPELKSGEHYRGDCPECGGDNTFSATNEYGTIWFHCFRASCTLSGSTHREMSYADISNAFSVGIRSQHEPVREAFVIPDYFVSVGERQEVIEYLRKNNCLSAYYDRRADVRYDPKQNRVVFLIKEGDICYDAVGRILDRTTNPKWFRYGCGHSLFFCKHCYDPIRFRPEQLFEEMGTKQGCLVEDAASACSVSTVCDGIALLGTQLGLANISSLIKYDVIYIALDKDASDKAFDLQRYLSFYCKDVKIVLLETDLKYLKEKEISHVIGRFS